MKKICSPRPRLIRSFFLGGLAALLSACGDYGLTPDESHFQHGYDAYTKGDYSTALSYLKPLVEKENPAAELLMARMYANGTGVAVDVDKAEFLRNLASLRVMKKSTLLPFRGPASNPLQTLSDRVAYYEKGPQPGDEAVDIFRPCSIARR